MREEDNFRKRVDDMNRNLPEPFSEEEEALIANWLKKRDVRELPDIEHNELYLNRTKAEIYLGIANKITPKDVRISQGTWLRIAVSIIFCAFLGISGYLLTRSEGGQFMIIDNTTSGAKQTTLPDGSVLWLNTGSKVRVPITFVGEKRILYLDEGEAFFQVSRNEQKPFLVHTPDLTVRVLGTSFNVKAYRQLDEVHVTVAEGMISVEKDQDELEKLTRNTEFIFDKAMSDYSIREVESEKFIQWRNGEIYLQDAPLKDLILALEHKYLVDISYPSEQMGSERISIHILPEQSLENVLAIMAKIFDIRFDIVGKEVNIRPRQH